jgi:hypothetical protein
MTTTTKPVKSITREQWLQHAVSVLRAETMRRDSDIVVPPVQVSCSWPGGGDSQKRIGECWSTLASKAGINEIFISPKIEDSAKVMSILAHELVHAVDNCTNGHKKAFVMLANRMGLEGKPTTMGLRPEILSKVTERMLDKHGAFPHQMLDKSKSPVKKQTTRMLKCACDNCGAIWRMSQSAIVMVEGNMSCPACHTHEGVAVGG